MLCLHEVTPITTVTPVTPTAAGIFWSLPRVELCEKNAVQGGAVRKTQDTEKTFQKWTRDVWSRRTQLALK